MNLADDTIASISTAVGEGALAVIRLSGQDSLHILAQVFVHDSIDIRHGQHHRLYYGKIVDPVTRVMIDEAMCVYMPAGRSSTMEEMAEIHCHGGRIVPREILKAVLSLGARVAEPGEFTRRAYLNGRLDLTQAEAIHDIITARSLLALQCALLQLDKRFSYVIYGFREKLLDILAHLEVLIDYPEEELDPICLHTAQHTLQSIHKETTQILHESQNARVVREGVRISIIGKTNVGKSSFFNYLLRQERAIVSDIHGTTRDFLDATVCLGGIPIEIIDTAGIRTSDDQIENAGKRMTFRLVGEVDYLIWMLDQSRAWDDDDEAVFYAVKDQCKRLILVINKTDLVPQLTLPTELMVLQPSIRTFSISLATKEGLEVLEDGFKEILLGRDFQVNEQTILCNMRHTQLLESFRKALMKVIHAIEQRLTHEFLALDLREALDTLGKITGEVTTDDVLTTIFNKFCVGK